MDYERMLRAYIRLVLDEEGVTFIMDPDGGCYVEGLSAEEQAEMLRLDREVQADEPPAQIC